MKQDLAKYDLIELLAGESWPETEQAKVVIGFTRALSGYVAEKLNPYFKDEDADELKKLAEQPEITPEQVIDFYKTRLPNLEEVLDEAILELKKIFLVDVYQRKINEFEQKLAQADEDNRPAFESQLKAWQSALEFSQQDDWDKVKQVLVVLPR
ncbi:MAG: hypothetical protein AB1721_02040 [Patescibacteria group bacterium]